MRRLTQPADARHRHRPPPAAQLPGAAPARACPGHRRAGRQARRQRAQLVTQTTHAQ
jgi:hypothetical protein